VQSVACTDEDETLAISETIQLDYLIINTFTTTTVSRSIYTTRPSKQEMYSGLLSHSCFKPDTAINSYSIHNR